MTLGMLSLGAAAMLVLAVVLPRRRAPSTVVQQLRVLVPSWRFFDGLGAAPELQFRYGASAEQLGPWHPVIAVPRRRWRQLVWNPDGNHALACHTLVERLQHDLDEQPGVAPDALVSYHLVLNLVRTAVPPDARGGVLQFQLHDCDMTDGTRLVRLASAVHRC